MKKKKNSLNVGQKHEQGAFYKKGKEQKHTWQTENVQRISNWTWEREHQENGGGDKVQRHNCWASWDAKPVSPVNSLSINTVDKP